MNKNNAKIIKNAGFGIPILIALIGTAIGRSDNSKVLIALFIGAIIYFAASFITSLSKKKSDTPNYIYIGGLGVSILSILYLVSKVYLQWGGNIQGWLLVLTFVPIFYLVGMSMNSKLNSGDVKQVKLVKKYLILLGILLIWALLIVIAYFLK